MSFELFSNNGTAVVTAGGTGAPTAGTIESWTISGSTLPSVSSTLGTYCYVCDANPSAQSEKMLITNISGGTATVTRGADGTTPVTHSSNFTIVNVVTRASLESLQENDWMNAVTLYGADPTGTNDSTTAIQNALTAARTATNGGTVYLPAGLYIISNVLQIGSNTALIGAGMGKTTIRAKSGSWSGVAQVGSYNGTGMLQSYNDTSVSNIIVKEITFDQNETGVTALPSFDGGSHYLNAPLAPWNVTGLLIERVQIINAIGYSMWLASCTNFTIRDCTVTTGQITAAQTWGTPAQQDGIHITSSTFGVIDGCFIDTGSTSGAGDDGIALQSYTVTHNITIKGCTIRSGTASCVDLALSGADIYDITIIGNTFYGTANAGVISQPFTGSGAMSKNITISGNTFDNMGLTGQFYSGIVFLDYSIFTTAAQGWADVSITGNSFHNFTANNGNGVIYCRYGKNLTITGNSFNNCNVQFGILVGDMASSNTVSLPVTGFTISDNMIDVSASTNTTFYSGIYTIDSTIGTITGNTVIGSGSTSATIESVGIGIAGYVSNASHTNVSGNKLYGWNTTNANSYVFGEYNNGISPDYNYWINNNTNGSTSNLSTFWGGHGVIQANPQSFGGITTFESFQILTSNYTSPGGTTSLQKLFNGSGNGVVTLPIGSYFFECQFSLSSMSASSGSFSFGIAGGASGPATIGGVRWMSVAQKSALSATASPSTTFSSATGATVISPANTTTTGYATVWGVIEITAAGTVMPGYATSVAAASIVTSGSFIRIWPAGPYSGTQWYGTWT